MVQTTVRIAVDTRNALKAIAHAEGRPMLLVLRSAVEAYRRRRFLQAVNRGYAATSTADTELREEIAAWDVTTADGLESVAEPDLHISKGPGRSSKKKRT